MKKLTHSKRYQKRLERADKVCQELRYAIANNDMDWKRICDLLESWMKVSGKDKYKRP